MSQDKEIHFTEKKIDDHWKEQVGRDKELYAQHPRPQDRPSGESSSKGPVPETAKSFLNLLSSLAYQAMIHLGEIPNPETQRREIHLEAAREVIDLLSHLRVKTEGNTSPEESEFFRSVLADLQMKFAGKV